MQLVLPVHHKHDYTLDNFITGRNDALIQHLSSLISTTLSNDTAAKSLSINGAMPSSKIIFVHGSSGLGKTHLLLAFTELAQRATLSHQYVDLNQLKHMPAMVISDLAKQEVVCLDNIDSIADSREWQVAVFDFINQFLEASGKALLISAKHSVPVCDFSLPDLASRLTWGTTYQLQELNENEKVSALSKHFYARGIDIQSETLSFIMKRSQRDMHKLMHLVDTLDELSLQSQRKLTIPFIKQVLSI